MEHGFLAANYLGSLVLVCSATFVKEPIEISAPDFDLEKTLSSGQVFHWQTYEDGFVGTIGNLPVYVEQRGPVLKLGYPQTARRGRQTHALSKAVAARYFALDHPLTKICASFPNDPMMNAARNFCHGLRIIRQPKWECLATFICSSMKQVAHIRQISRALRERFGTRHLIYGTHVYPFPGAGKLARATEKELRECALGYRAKNLLATAKRVALGEADLDAWSELSNETLAQRLQDLPGVGAKVAHCVMLFAYERVAAFPIDVWIERVLRQTYFKGKRQVRAKELAVFATEYFGAHAGYAQQYLFHYARSTRRAKAITGG
jgi:N-glycosylase/DNA lyase